MNESTRQEVWQREGGRCENPACMKFHAYGSSDYELHHRYFRSQYRGIDRDEAWNLSLLCGESCHKNGSGAVHGGNSILDKYLKAKADKAKPKEERATEKVPKDKRAQMRRKSEYKKKVDAFKKKNGGLSPWQVKYRRQKEYLSNINNQDE